MMMVTTVLALVSLMVASVRCEGPGGNTVNRRRCFTCRSRGDRGDCRDPFTFPESEEENRRQSVNTAVGEAPCSTGWCSKVSKVQTMWASPPADGFLG